MALPRAPHRMRCIRKRTGRFRVRSISRLLILRLIRSCCRATIPPQSSSARQTRSIAWIQKAHRLASAGEIRPVITEVDLEPGLTIILYTDGLTHAGKRRGNPMDVANAIQAMLDEQDPSPQELADALLAHAVNLDENRPSDDISVVALKVSSREDDDVRRMSVRLPLR